MNEEWKRCRGAKENMPEIPKVKGYVRRMADKGVRLAAIKVQLAKIDKLSKDPLNDMSEFYEDQED